MNADAIMSDASTAPGGSQAAPVEMLVDERAGKPTASPWNTKKFREDYEMARSRLSDAKFDITEYPDPLLPRSAQETYPMPAGITPEMEAKWLEMIRTIRAKAKSK